VNENEKKLTSFAHGMRRNGGVKELEMRSGVEERSSTGKRRKEEEKECGGERKTRGVEKVINCCVRMRRPMMLVFMLC
jgi:hypothetical protein